MNDEQTAQPINLVELLAKLEAEKEAEIAEFMREHEAWERAEAVERKREMRMFYAIARRSR